MRIYRDPDVSPGAYHTLCCEAIIDLLATAHQMIHGDDSDRHAEWCQPYIEAARNVASDAGMSETEYLALLQASSF